MIARLLFACAALSALGLPLPAHADSAKEPGRLRLGLRTGFALPYGRFADVRTLATFRDTNVHALSDEIHGAIPVWLDAGYQLMPQLMLGGYAALGLVLPRVAPATQPLSGGCPENFDCSGLGWRLGIQAEYRFLPRPLRPWLALGLGYEWVHSHIQGQQLDIELASWHSGPEFLHLQGGADFQLSQVLAIGPFLALTAMQYTSCSLEFLGQSQPCQLDEKAWHGWISFGMRGALQL
jgi:hypothetical protein